MEQQPSLTMNNKNKNNNSATSSSLPNPLSQTKMKDKKMENKNQSAKRRLLPTPEELISHYESKGFESKQASIQAISDLQNALFRVVTNKTPQQQNNPKLQETMALRMFDTKLDTKPGFIHMFGIGVASNAVFRGLETLFLPHVVRSFGNICNAVRSATASHPK